MVTVGMNYEVVPGREGDFEQVFASVQKLMDAMPGHEHTQLFRAVDNPQTYLIISRWSDRKAFDGFVASEQFRKVTTWGKEQILARRPEHEIYGSDTPAPTGGCPVH